MKGFKYDTLWAISDIHGYYDEFTEILRTIGVLDSSNQINLDTTTKVVLLGDYIDKGPKPLETLYLVDTLVQHGLALALLGNHDRWLLRKLMNQDVMMNPEREGTLRTIETSPLFSKDFTFNDIVELLDALPYWVDVDGVKFVHAKYSESTAHLPKKKQVKMLYGPTDTSKPLQDGMPYREPWYEDYDGEHGKVIFGHYALSNKIMEFDNCVCVDCGAFKTGVLGAYEVTTGRSLYVTVQREK